MACRRFLDDLQFQPTLPARGATLCRNGGEYAMLISTHAPRTGSDQCCQCGKRRLPLFQPTLPARGATMDIRPAQFFILFQPTLPARGATTFYTARKNARDISTHAPRTGSDECEAYIAYAAWCISTHAPRTGSDMRRQSQMARINHFNPRSPHGERPTSASSATAALPFQPTLPARGATPCGCSFQRATQFQPTLPARGATRIVYIFITFPLQFQPTLPARGATLSCLRR